MFYILYYLFCCENFTSTCFSDGPENIQILGPSEIQLEQTLTLNCFVESKPPASYTWTLNGINIHNSSVFTKVIRELSDSGNYTCQAMNNITGRTSSGVRGLSVTGTELVFVADVVDILIALSPHYYSSDNLKSSRLSKGFY